MSKEVHIDYESGNTIYFVRLNPSGQVALSNGSFFEDWGAGGNNANDYDVSAPEVGSGGCRYVGDFDADLNIGAGNYTVVAFLQLGDNPADGDDVSRPFSNSYTLIVGNTRFETRRSISCLDCYLYKLWIILDGAWQRTALAGTISVRFMPGLCV